MKTHNAWPIRRFDALSRDAIDTRKALGYPSACTGNCVQGRHCDCAPKEAASCCTEIGADGTPSTWESADAEVMIYLCKLCAGVLAFCAFVWAAT
jgi:hypothetical protein